MKITGNDRNADATHCVTRTLSPDLAQPRAALRPAADAPAPDIQAQPAILKTLEVTVQHFFGGFTHMFQGLTDPRDPDHSTYSLPTLMATGVLMFLLRLGARRQIASRLRGNGPIAPKYQALFGAPRCPHGNTLNYAFVRTAVAEVQVVVMRMTETWICSEVLFLYPQDLVAVEERFGSWMVLYGYANYATAEKLVANGTVTEDGWLVVKDARYRAVCVLYEPFPTEALLALLRTFAEQGGTVIWSSTPPLASATRATLEALAGATYAPLDAPMGLPLPSRQVVFENGLAGVPNQMVLTNFVVDRVFPLVVQEGTGPVASLPTGGPRGTVCAGTRRVTAGGGQVVLLGFRPEDDQSASTGVEIRTWFEILNALGIYAGDGNPAVVSRSTEYLATTFPNGAIALCPHYRTHPENWPGGFYRDEEEDARLLAENPVPDDEIVLDGLCVAGQSVRYHGRHAVIWRMATGDSGADGDGLVAFAGSACTGIEVNCVGYAWSEVPVDIAWHPLGEAYATEAVTPLYRVWVGSTGSVRVPLMLGDQAIKVWQGAYVSSIIPSTAPVHLGVGQGVAKVPFGIEGGDLVLDIDETLVGHWLYVTQSNS